ncbi:MAG: monovalent cation/H+ antiporter complex subunit F [Bacteroidales bacterium]|jgi:multicomponent Na+:H+ antiporter subunit F|nr:monovalent cation/H+ antiporter complex subunit F [Bacteroidales bacterium]
MINTILIISAGFISLALLFSLYRFIKGPSVSDRVVSFDIITISSLTLIALIAYISGRSIYIDVALVYGLLSFIGVIIVARYLERGI